MSLPPIPTTLSATDFLRGAALAGHITILDLLDDLPWFVGAADWTAWRSFLCAVYGLQMSEAELAVYRKCTGRAEPPTSKAKEVWCPTGRRGRKSAIAALVGVWEGTLARDYDPLLAPGERAVIPILAKNKAEAHQIRNYAVAILDSSPAMRGFLAAEPKAEEIALTTRVDLRIKAASLTAGRSHTTPAALLDEVAFFRSDESLVPDSEILTGIRPGMATVPDALLVAMSSPYARRGELWKHHAAHYGKENDQILVWQADTLTMHDTPQIRVFVAEAYQADPVAASAEYGAQFRTDVENYVPIEVVDACTVKLRFGLEPDPDQPRRYFGFCDPSGGSQDSMTLAISHYEAGMLVLDHLDEEPAPFKPEDVTERFATTLKRYGLKTVKGDKYAGEWPKDRFRAHGISYIESERTKADIYRDVLPLLTSKRAELLDNPRLRSQLVGLDRRTARGGRDSIDHGPGGHDDVANAACGALLEADHTGRRRKHPEKSEEEPKDLHDLRRQEIKKALAEERREREGASDGPQQRLEIYRRGRH